jgi:hypothetical protein
MHRPARSRAGPPPPVADLMPTASRHLAQRPARQHRRRQIWREHGARPWVTAEGTNLHDMRVLGGGTRGGRRTSWAGRSRTLPRRSCTATFPRSWTSRGRARPVGRHRAAGTRGVGLLDPADLPRVRGKPVGQVAGGRALSQHLHCHRLGRSLRPGAHDGSAVVNAYRRPVWRGLRRSSPCSGGSRDVPSRPAEECPVAARRTSPWAELGSGLLPPAVPG